MKHNEKTEKKTPQRVVPCPVWLKKRILANLKKTSVDRLYPERAKEARKILAELNDRHHRTDSRNTIEDRKADVGATETTQPVTAVQPAQRFRMGSWVVDTLGRRIASFFNKALSRDRHAEKADPTISTPVKKPLPSHVLPSLPQAGASRDHRLNHWVRLCKRTPSGVRATLKDYRSR